MVNFPLPRLDKDEFLRNHLSKYCRLKRGEVWIDPVSKHKVICAEADDDDFLRNVFNGEKAVLAVQDPPYNIVAFNQNSVKEFIDWCKKWIDTTGKLLKQNSSLYVWLGADQKKHFEPFGEFVTMMKDSGFESRSFITMRNQRGYGTQKNWMAIRQELLYYILGKPVFNTKAVYTDIPKVVKGFYKTVSGARKENLERSKSPNIRAGNVWVDIQQVFYLMEENVNGCYAQKPLKALERIIQVSSNKNDLVLDSFAHSGTTLIACEKLNRRCNTIDIDPIYCEITIRRLENFRNSGKTGWQNSNPFSGEVMNDKEIMNYLKSEYKIDPDLTNSKGN